MVYFFNSFMSCWQVDGSGVVWLHWGNRPALVLATPSIWLVRELWYLEDLLMNQMILNSIFLSKSPFDFSHLHWFLFLVDILMIFISWKSKKERLSNGKLLILMDHSHVFERVIRRLLGKINSLCMEEWMAVVLMICGCWSVILGNGMLLILRGMFHSLVVYMWLPSLKTSKRMFVCEAEIINT